MLVGNGEMVGADPDHGLDPNISNGMGGTGGKNNPPLNPAAKAWTNRNGPNNKNGVAVVEEPELQPLDQVNCENGSTFWVKPEIKKLAQDVDMQLQQSNGQRLFGPPLGNQGTPKPGYGTELFVAKVPRNCSEVDIFPLFRKVGPIYQIRMMLDFSGTTRGYCFVRFCEKSDAEKAILQLNGYEIQKGRCIGVVKSLDNCRLYIAGIPQNRSNEEVKAEIMKVVEGVVKVIIVGSDEENILRKRFCYISYETHRAASISRRSFLAGRSKLWGRHYVAEWAQPAAQLKSIILWNVPEATTEQKIWELCESVSKNQAFCVKRSKCGFLVEFKTHQGADLVLEGLCSTEIEGQQILGIFVKQKSSGPVHVGRTFTSTWRNHNRSSRSQSRGNSHGGDVVRRPWVPPMRFQVNGNNNGNGHSGVFRPRHSNMQPNMQPTMQQFHAGVSHNQVQPMGPGNQYQPQQFMPNNNVASFQPASPLPYNMQSNMYYNNQTQVVRYDQCDPYPMQSSWMPNNAVNNNQLQNNVFNFEPEIINAFQSMSVQGENQHQYRYDGQNLQNQNHMGTTMYSPFPPGYGPRPPMPPPHQSPLLGLLGQHTFVTNVGMDPYSPSYF